MLKRLFDIVLSIFLMLALVPVIVSVAVVIWAQMGRPVFFVQKRPGMNGSPFMMIKFRTMKNAVDDAGTALPDSARLTQLGRFLRNTSLDELPELWNVLKGDMSLVGPRPLLMQYIPLYNSEQMRRHEVRPGITGWAQVNGRNAICWEEKFVLDLWYVDNNNLCLDLKILFLSVMKVLRMSDISAKGMDTMPAFTGSEEKKQ